MSPLCAKTWRMCSSTVPSRRRQKQDQDLLDLVNNSIQQNKQYAKFGSQEFASQDFGQGLRGFRPDSEKRVSESQNRPLKVRIRVK
eukprot:14694583-Heterocapsa_arctica.AAC.1